MVDLSRQVPARLPDHAFSGWVAGAARSDFPALAGTAQQSVDGARRGAVVCLHSSDSGRGLLSGVDADRSYQTAVGMGPAAPPRARERKLLAPIFRTSARRAS